MNDEALEWVAKIVVVLFFYAAVSGMVYRFKHPGKTETQLFLECHKALLWQK